MFSRSFTPVYEFDDDFWSCHDEMWFMKDFLHTFEEDCAFICKGGTCTG